MSLMGASSGSSVLLNKLIEDYKDRFLTMNLAAPVSSSKDMELFIMLFRQLTQHVIAALKQRSKANIDQIISLGRESESQERRAIVMRNTAMILVVLFALCLVVLLLMTLTPLGSLCTGA